MTADLAVPPDGTVRELVVDLHVRDLVVARLGRLVPPVEVTDAEEDETLRLALLRLSGVEEFGARNGRAADPIQAVLDEVRAEFDPADPPVLELNRHVGGIIGFPQSKPMRVGDGDVAVADPLPPFPAGGRGEGVRVGVLDTRLVAHDLLAGHVDAAGNRLFDPPAVPLPAWAGHATFIAGLIAARAPGATIVARGVIDNVSGRATVWSTARAMVRFLAEDVAILNLSLGCYGVDPTPPAAFRRAVEVLAPHMLLVAAAGNHGPDAEPFTWPAALPDVVAVGATYPPVLGSDAAEFSPSRPWIDQRAPGCFVVSTYLTGYVVVDPRHAPETVTPFAGFAAWSGTSFAAALLSGEVAARTVPGSVTPASALQAMWAEPASVLWADVAVQTP